MKSERDETPELPDEKTTEAEQQAEAAAESKQEPAEKPTDLPSDLAAAYRKAVAERQEYYDLLLRRQAEIENIRKRLEREKEEFLQHATTGLIKALLPTLDALERALRQRDEKVPKEFSEGMEMIHRELLDVLKRAGLSVVESEGKTFDPHVHQAVETVEAEGRRDQEVVEELQRGYKLKQRLLRPAIVKVAVNKGSQK